ncbi:acetyl- synthetase [Pyrrhoderma noxium]|uniref:Acetyl-synthetase n=1 Tax=Pyrrhoderma noxium TaxID=2282107 RepID=A0A286UI50_9AGAM|nr:acetyl- synthetase [Pyrrhoderma noxium]
MSVFSALSLSQSFIYENPSITKLAVYLSSLQKGFATATVESIESKRRELFKLVEKYTLHFPAFSGSIQQMHNEQVVLLTGATDSLGSNILAHLISRPEVTRIYSMSRPYSTGISVKERHIIAFKRESLDIGLLEDLKVILMDGNAASPGFKIDRVLYDQTADSVTHIIHNAWRVNFNVSVSSFESNIKSVRNFIDLSLSDTRSNPAHLIFISSVGVLRNSREHKLMPERYQLQPDNAIGMGYGESKWVSEEIIRRASEITPLRSTIIRCGQMTGG